MKNIIFIAPPAAGKGTISDYLVKNYHYEHLSTGDLLRSEVASGSELGKEIDKIISLGNFVSDELIIRLVSSELNKLTDKPFILDGFPRTEVQAISLDKMLKSKNIDHNLVVYLDAPLEVLLKRAVGRVICPKCKRSYNLDNPKLKPIHENICDDCGVTLVRREDDNEKTIKVRYDSFMKDTKPILAFYQNKGILLEIDATMPLDIIYEILIEKAEVQIRDGCSND